MDLRTRAIKSVGWLAVSRLWTQAVSWAVTVILARLLLPADYGLFAMAMAVIHFLDLFQEMGLGSAIVQRREVSQRQLNAVFWLSVAIGLVLLGGAWVAAPFVARFYAEPQLAWMVRVLATSFLLNSLGTISHGLLTRAIDFRQRSLAEGVATVAGAIVSVGLAWSGQGVWALVWGHVVRQLCRNVALVRAAGWHPGLAVTTVGLGGMVSFGMHVTGASAIGSVIGLVNTAIVGRGLGGPALGLYSMADSLGRTAINKISISVINQVSFPLFSRLQDDPGRLRASFLTIARYLAVVSFPLQLGLALVGHDVVVLLLTDRWLGMLEVFQVFALGGIVYVQSLPAAPLLNARGRVRAVFWLSVALSCGSAAGAAIGVLIGRLLFVAIGTMTAACIARLVALSIALAEMRLSPTRYARAIAAPAGAALAMAVVVATVRYALGGDAGSLARLAWSVGAGVTTYSAVLLVADRRLGSDVKGIMQDLFAPSRA